MTVTWKEIAAECDGYRAGFVAVFRRYEGEPTDERDGQGRIVKVSANSFAEHVGISPATFKRWIKNVDEQTPLSGRPASGPVGTARTGQVGRQIAKSPTVSVEDKVGMLADLISDRKVLAKWQEERTPVVTEADAKAANAAARAFATPLMEAATRLQVPAWIDQLRDITNELSENELPKADITKLDKAVRKLAEEIEVQKFRLGMSETLS